MIFLRLHVILTVSFYDINLINLMILNINLNGIQLNIIHNNNVQPVTERMSGRFVPTWHAILKAKNHKWPTLTIKREDKHSNIYKSLTSATNA